MELQAFSPNPPGVAPESRVTIVAQSPVVDKISLSFRNINMIVPAKTAKAGHTTKHVLSDINGACNSGTLTAIMGPSGSGKTSLLNTLAGRVLKIKGGSLTGQIYTNGAPRQEDTFKSISAYVTQDDSLFALLTVRETLLLAVNLRLGSSVSMQEKHEYVNNLANQLGLTKTMGTIIGDGAARGVSGGERKRVSIAVELISNPPLIFLDEPTSGLDSFQSLSVMSSLKNLANEGRTVIASIHQPRPSIISKFDQVIFLSGGLTMYRGTLDGASDYFRKLGHPFPEHESFTDFILDLIAMDYRTPRLQEMSAARIGALANAWRVEEQRLPKVQGGEVRPQTSPGRADSIQWSLARSVNQFLWLFWRSFTLTLRNLPYIAAKVGLSIFFALLIGFVNSNIKHDQKGTNDYMGAIFILAMINGLQSQVVVLNTFPLERVIVEKEISSKSYSVYPYYTSKVMSELPFTILDPIIFSSIAYFLIGLEPTAGNFFSFMLICILLAICGNSLGIVISALAPNVEVANAVAPGFVVFFILFSGFVINSESLPAGAKWLINVSYLKWAVQGLAINQFEGATFACDPDPYAPCIQEGHDVLKLFNYQNSTVGKCVLMMVAIALAVHVTGFAILASRKVSYMQIKRVI